MGGCRESGPARRPVPKRPIRSTCRPPEAVLGPEGAQSGPKRPISVDLSATGGGSHPQPTSRPRSARFRSTCRPPEAVLGPEPTARRRGRPSSASRIDSGSRWPPTTPRPRCSWSTSRTTSPTRRAGCRARWRRRSCRSSTPRCARAIAAGAPVFYTQDWHPRVDAALRQGRRHLAGALRHGHVGRGAPPRLVGRGAGRAQGQQRRGRLQRASPCATPRPARRCRPSWTRPLARPASTLGRRVRPGHRLLRVARRRSMRVDLGYPIAVLARAVRAVDLAPGDGERAHRRDARRRRAGRGVTRPG